MTRSRPVSVSFEFFPPGDEAMEKTLWSRSAISNR